MFYLLPGHDRGCCRREDNGGNLRKPETPIYDSDVGIIIIIEAVVVLQDLDDMALATAMLFGLLYSLNTLNPSQLHYTFEVIQKWSWSWM